MHVGFWTIQIAAYQYPTWSCPKQLLHLSKSSDTRDDKHFDMHDTWVKMKKYKYPSSLA
jgi:hypothetical protein